MYTPLSTVQSPNSPGKKSKNEGLKTQLLKLKLPKLKNKSNRNVKSSLTIKSPDILTISPSNNTQLLKNGVYNPSQFIIDSKSMIKYRNAGKYTLARERTQNHNFSIGGSSLRKNKYSVSPTHILAKEELNSPAESIFLSKRRSVLQTKQKAL